MVAIIAGTGSLPVAACQALQNQGKKFCVISLFPDDNAAALKAAAQDVPVMELMFYRASDILQALLDHKVNEVVMLGKVDKQHFFRNIKMDWLTIKFLAGIAYKNDQAILQKLVDLLAGYNITVLKQHEVLRGHITGPGIITGTITEQLQHNITFGMQVAENISKLDLGQTVVVKDSIVLAIEAIEGTDACIQRGIELGNGGVIICKSAQAAHNPQFDLPTLGSNTLAGLKKGQVCAIAWLATHTLIADYQDFVQAAQALDIALIAV